VGGFANQISDDPVLLPLLKVLDGEVRDDRELRTLTEKPQAAEDLVTELNRRGVSEAVARQLPRINSRRPTG
jgi:hypothetical protein